MRKAEIASTLRSFLSGTFKNEMQEHRPLLLRRNGVLRRFRPTTYRNLRNTEILLLKTFRFDVSCCREKKAHLMPRKKRKKKKKWRKT